MAVTALSRHRPSISPILVDCLMPFLLLFCLLLVLFFLVLFFCPFLAVLFFFWVLFLFLRVFLFLLAASASADRATREDPSSSERLLSSWFSAEARTARTRRRPR